MAVSRGLRRLLRIRGLEEEQNRVALESAMGELHRLESVLEIQKARECKGRALIGSSAYSGETSDRQSGLVESDAGRRAGMVVAARIAGAQVETARLRERFLEKRVERRQAETLIEETEARDAVEAGRKSQQSHDDWYRARAFRQQQEAVSKSETAEPAAARPDGIDH
jgi:hypothetical protein